MEHHHHHAAEADSPAMAELLDLDAEVLHSYLSEAVDWIHEFAGDLPGGRILDLGTGTGTGALAFAQRFEQADVVAVDLSAQFLHRVMDKAREHGVADRVHTVQADLDAAWPAIDPVDLVWASNSLHHMAEPERVLADVLATIRPGGLLAVAEMDGFPRFLPSDLAIEARIHAIEAERKAHEMPHLGSDFGPLLDSVGFTVESKRRFIIDLRAPLPASAGRYAQAALRRLRASLDGQMSASELATLDSIIDGDGPDSILRRDDLTVRTARTVWVARRP